MAQLKVGEMTQSWKTFKGYQTLAVCCGGEGGAVQGRRSVAPEGTTNSLRAQGGHPGMDHHGGIGPLFIGYLGYAQLNGFQRSVRSSDFS